MLYYYVKTTSLYDVPTYILIKKPYYILDLELFRIYCTVRNTVNSTDNKAHTDTRAIVKVHIECEDSIFSAPRLRRPPTDSINRKGN